MVVLIWMSCRAAHDAELAREPIEAGELVAVFPPDGAPTVFGDVPVEVVLGARAQGEVPTVTLTRGDEVTDLRCHLAEGGTVADCGPVPDVGVDEVLVFDVTAGSAAARSTTLGRKPQAGVGWNLFDGVEFAALGGGATAVTLANDELGKSDCFGALDGYDGTPGDWTFVAGPVAFDPDGIWLEYPGFAFVLPVTLDDGGALRGSAPTAWLPFELQGKVVHVLLLDVTLRGHLDGEHLRDVVVRGVVPALGLEELVAPLGGLSGTVLQSIVLDVDRDGDGEPESASVVLRGTPRPATIWE